MTQYPITIVGGCGHVGIPLGLALASRNFNVSLLDRNQAAVDCIRAGKLPFAEEGAQDILDATLGKNLHATMELDVVDRSKCVIFVVGTPVDRHMNPCVKEMIDVILEYIPHIHDGQLVVMRSTLYPGTFRIIEQLFKNAGRNVKLAFCPERIQQGKGIQEIYSLPQIVSGASEPAQQEAAEIFRRLTGKIIPATPEEAELAKLMTNSWRYLEFAIANQFYIMAHKSGIDFHQLFNIMTEDYPRAKSFARPGLAAGPCLLKDTLQLASFYNNNFFLGHAAMLVNEGLPEFLVEQLQDNMPGKSLAGRKIALLGMTFKANSDDVRDSLSFKIRKKLEQRLAFVMPVDPYIPDTWPLDKALEQAEGIILGTPHDAFKTIAPQVPFIDCWGFWK